MGNVGLPGTGLGGLLYLLLALAMPLVQLVRSARGHRAPDAWPRVWSQFAIACGVLASVVLTLALLTRAVGGSGPTDGLVLLGPVAALGVLACLVLALRVWSELLPRGRHRSSSPDAGAVRGPAPRDRPPPEPSPASPSGPSGSIRRLSRPRAR